MIVTVAPHPLLDLGAFLTTFSAPIGTVASPQTLMAWLALDAAAPMTSNDEVRSATRNLLRKGGFKPTGRSKPASEYLLGAAAAQPIGSINVAVDACNAVSLHSGLPISVVDAAIASEPLRVAIAGAGESYVFNASGQTIELAGLLCLYDREGPCANAVKDAQRTKTHAGSVRTLSLVWGSRGLGERTQATVRWYRELLEGVGATTEAVEIVGG